MNNFFNNPSLSQVSFSGNSANNNGGGMYNQKNRYGNSNPQIVNSIFWNSQDGRDGDEKIDASAQIYNEGGRPIISYTLIQGSEGITWDGALGTNGGYNLDADPLFVKPIHPDEVPNHNRRLSSERRLSGH